MMLRFRWYIAASSTTTAHCGLGCAIMQSGTVNTRRFISGHPVDICPPL